MQMPFFTCAGPMVSAVKQRKEFVLGIGTGMVLGAAAYKFAVRARPPEVDMMQDCIKNEIIMPEFKSILIFNKQGKGRITVTVGNYAYRYALNLLWGQQNIVINLNYPVEAREGRRANTFVYNKNTDIPTIVEKFNDAFSTNYEDTLVQHHGIPQHLRFILEYFANRQQGND